MDSKTLFNNVCKHPDVPPQEVAELREIDTETLSALVDARIVEVRGVSGCPATVEDAKQAPRLTRMHAMSGLVYDIVGWDQGSGAFRLEAVR